MKRKGLLGRAKSSIRHSVSRPTRSKIVMAALIVGAAGAYTAYAAASWWKRLDPRNW